MESDPSRPVERRREHISQIRSLFDRSIDVKREVAEHHADVIVEMAYRIAEALRRGGKLLLCGNGGSAADAHHLAAELLIRLGSGQAGRRPYRHHYVWLLGEHPSRAAGGARLRDVDDRTVGIRRPTCSVSL